MKLAILVFSALLTALVPAIAQDWPAKVVRIVVPLKIYFNAKGRAKVEIALARGKKLHDKRDTLKKRSWDRERGRLMRAKG